MSDIVSESETVGRVMFNAMGVGGGLGSKPFLGFATIQASMVTVASSQGDLLLFLG